MTDPCEVTEDSSPEPITEVVGPSSGGSGPCGVGEITVIFAPVALGSKHGFGQVSDAVTFVPTGSGAKRGSDGASMGVVFSLEAEGWSSEDCPECPPGGGPTFIITDNIGFKDVPTWAWNLPDFVGLRDGSMTWGLNPTDNYGLIDALALTGTPQFTDRVGFKDSHPLLAQETALVRASGHAAFDADAWGDSWCDSTPVTGVNVNHGAEATMTVENVVAGGVALKYAVIEIDFTRFVGFSANPSLSSTLTFKCLWPNVIATPAAILLANPRSNATRPFLESTVTAGNHPAYATPSPYTQRTFPFNQDGVLRTHTITFTTAEVNDFIGKWLEVLLLVDNLTLGTFTVYPREAALASNLTTYDLRLQR